MTPTQQPAPTLYVGTYSVRASKGIYVFAFDPQTGDVTLQQTVDRGKSPSFLAIHPSGQYLYAVHEEDEQGPDRSGSVSAYAIDPQTGQLAFLTSQLTHGQGPCHIAIDRSGTLAFVANYEGGSLAVFPIQANGGLGEASQLIRYTGRGVDPERQTRSHVHSAAVSVDNRLLYVSDLGTDTLHVYRIDVQQGRLITCQSTPCLHVSAGSGPRMLAVHPQDTWLYSLKEMSSTVARLRRDRQTDAVTLVEDDVAFLPETYAGERSGGDIHLDADGRYLYVTNRGNNTLAVLSVDADGTLTPCGLHDTAGDEPRHLLVDAPSRYVLVGHQQSDNITLFTLDASRGELTPTGKQLSVPSPVCLLMHRRH